MGEPANRGADSMLRDHLHAQLCDFVELYADQARRGGDTMLASEVRLVHQRRLDALMDGEEVADIHRYSLPDWHPESSAYGGNPTDRFVLGADDILRFAPPY